MQWTIAASSGERGSSRISTCCRAIPSSSRKPPQRLRRHPGGRSVRIKLLVAVLGIAAWLCAIAPLQAQGQGPDRRHASAVFGASDPRLTEQPREGVLTASGSVFGAFDDTLFAVT